MVHWPGGLSRQNNIAALCILIWVGECLPKHILVDVGRHQATLAVPMHLPVWNHHWECQPPGEITGELGLEEEEVAGEEQMFSRCRLHFKHVESILLYVLLLHRVPKLFCDPVLGESISMLTWTKQKSDESSHKSRHTTNSIEWKATFWLSKKRHHIVLSF